MKTKLGIVGCGFLGNIVADAWKKGLLPGLRAGGRDQPHPRFG